MSNNKTRRKFIPIARPNIGAVEKEYILEALDSGWVSSAGPFVSRFEKEYAEFVGTSEAVSISNGTDALFIALKACGIGSGDEVIIPALTFVAVASAVVRAGAIPHFVDVDSSTWCIDPLDVERAINRKTKAVVAVHSYGHPADMERIVEICAINKIFVVEDCAEAHGAKSNGMMVGSIGDIGCFSFYGNKIITTGEGGMITSSNGDLTNRCRYLKDHAMDEGRTYYHSEVGYNCRMSNLQAALGCAQLSRLPEFLENRRQILNWYEDAFDSSLEIQTNRKCDWADPTVWMVCAVFEGKSLDWRNNCIKMLRADGVDSRPFFHPLCDLPPYRHFPRTSVGNGGITKSYALSESGLNLPTSIDMTATDVEYIVSSLSDIVARLG